MAKKEILTLRMKTLIIIFLLIISLTFLLFNKTGLTRYYQVKKEKEDLYKLKEQKQKELDELKYREQVLQNPNSKEALQIFEKIAREKYEMARPEEEVIKIKEK